MKKSLIICSIAGMLFAASVSARIFYFDPTSSSRGTFRDEGNLNITDGNFLLFKANSSASPIFYLNSKGDITQQFSKGTDKNTAWQIFSQTSANPPVQTLRFEVNKNAEFRLGQASNMAVFKSNDTINPYIDFAIGSVTHAGNNNGIRIYNANGDHYSSLGVRDFGSNGAVFLGFDSSSSGIYVNAAGLNVQGDSASTTRGLFNNNSISVAVGTGTSLTSIFESNIPVSSSLFAISPVAPATTSACENKGGVVSGSDCLLRVLGLTGTAGGSTLDSSLALKKVTLLDTGVYSGVPDNSNNLYLAASQAWMEAQGFVNPDDSGKMPLRYLHIDWNENTGQVGDQPNITTPKPSTYNPNSHTHNFDAYVVNYYDNNPPYPDRTLDCDQDNNPSTHSGGKIIWGQAERDDIGCLDFNNAGCYKYADEDYLGGTFGTHTGDDSWTIGNGGGTKFSGFIYCIKGDTTQH